MRNLDQFDWSRCGQIERIAGKIRGRYVIQGTQIEPDVVLIDEDLGRTPEQTHASYPSLSLETICAIRAFARSGGAASGEGVKGRLKRAFGL